MNNPKVFEEVEKKPFWGGKGQAGRTVGVRENSLSMLNESVITVDDPND